jgi:hypothetical protein
LEVMMPSVSLDWLDDIPNAGVPGVPGVLPQESTSFAGTPEISAGVPGVPEHRRNTLEHLVEAQGVPAKPLQNRVEHQEHLGTPDLWIGLAELPAPLGGWGARLSLLNVAIVPRSILPARWSQILADADVFLRRWGKQALALGWSEVDLFAVPPGPERWGRGGLVMALSGRPVIAMTAEAATIQRPQGPATRYYRRDKPGAVLLWDPRAFIEQDGQLTGH